MWTGLVGSVGTGTLPPCTTGQILKYSGTGWVCSTFTGAMPICANGKILKSNGTSWYCGEDIDTDTFGSSLWQEVAGQFIHPIQWYRRKVGIGFNTPPSATLQVSGTFIAGALDNIIAENTAFATIG